MGHVELQAALQVEVGPEESRKAAQVFGGETGPPGRVVAQDDLDQVGIEVGDRGLDEVEREGGHLDVLAVVAGQVAGLALP